MADATNPATFAQPVSRPSRWGRWMNVGYISAFTTALAILVGAGAFYAGRQSATLELTNVTAKWKDAQQRADASSASLDSVKKELDVFKHSMSPVNLDTVSSSIKDREKIRELTAQMNTYRNLVEKKSIEKTSDSALSIVLSSPNARVLPFKLMEPIPHAVVNLAMADGGEAAFVASNLPAERQYQLWFVKKDKDDVTRGQSFTASTERTILELGTGTLTGVTQILVTEGVASDGDKPTRPPVMTLILE